MKICSGCSTEKEDTDFYKSNGYLSTLCKVCKRAAAAKYRGENSEGVKRKAALRSADYYKRNSGSIKLRVREWQEANRARCNANNAKYRSSKELATPDWLTDYDLEMLHWTYHCAKVAEDMTGVTHHVDHIVPLRGKNICGLHVPWNLQVIPARENHKKSNKFTG